MEKKLGKKGKIKRAAQRYWQYYILFLPCAVLFILFSYIPMGGIILAFKEYIPRLGVYGSPLADPFYRHFLKLFEDAYFWTVLKNTLVLSGLRLAIGFFFPVLLALLFNELKFKAFGKTVQTVLFIPYFISWVVLAGILKQVFGNDGFVNSALTAMGGNGVKFLTQGGPFLALVILSEIWKGCGYGMIIYLAAITSIDRGLYEAVEIDGGNRLHKMIYITLPGISGTIAVQFILSLSGILNGGFDQIFNLYSVPVYDVADILDTYLYRVGLAEGKVELGTALGLFKSAIGFCLVVFSNKIIKKLGGNGIW